MIKYHYSIIFFLVLSILLISYIFFYLLKQNNNKFLLKIQKEKERNIFLEEFNNYKNNIFDVIKKNSENNLSYIKKCLNENFSYNNTNIDKMSNILNNQLYNINNQFDKKISENFHQSNKISKEIIEKIAYINTAQNGIKDLSCNIDNLNNILVDKRSRGVFGEIQLNNLISNILPKYSYKVQYTLSNNKRVDCIIFLKDTTMKLPIDSKFPLENYQKMYIEKGNTTEFKRLSKIFIKDIKYHIDDIAKKYILKKETTDYAIMFIPSESIFNDIYKYYPEIVNYSYKKKVWITSPTTIIAMLNIINIMLKDQYIYKKESEIKKYLLELDSDFSRFHIRVENFMKHFNLSKNNLELLLISSNKIINKFKKIKKIEIQDN